MTTWERRTQWPLAGLALLFLGAYAWPVLEPGLAPALTRLCSAVVWLAWAAFAIDYVVRLVQAEDPRRWALHHLVDLAVLVLPVLRPLRVLRLLNVLRVVNRPTANGLRGRVGVYVGGAAVLLALTASVAVLGAERGARGATITTFGDALWWACATMSTVGYGDEVPVTGVGRLIGVGLMVSGIAILGTVTATFASWLLQSVAAETTEATRVVTADIDTVETEMRALRGEVARLADLLSKGESDGARDPHRPGPAR